MNKIIRYVFGLIGAAVGATLLYALVEYDLLARPLGFWAVLAYLAAAAGGFFVFYALARWAFAWIRQVVDSITAQVERVPLGQTLVSTFGLLLGLVMASIISNPILQLSISRLGNVIGVMLAVLIYILCGFIGLRLAGHYFEEIMHSLRRLRDSILHPSEEGEGRTSRKSKRRAKRERDRTESEEESLLDPESDAVPKILDTSVIIDGRIFEVMRTGFLEGPIVISHYVLEELQFISDSADTLRRERGRKGLDRIHDLQTQSDLEILIDNSNIDQVKEVDLKLMLLTKRYGGRLVTNDYNLNKVSSVQNIPVLNVNDLSNALKPIVIPGEKMRLHILKAGKEAGQGLAYLDDGTMIVIENGYQAIGQTRDTVVTSVLQTSAGKMIFTRIPDL